MSVSVTDRTMAVRRTLEGIIGVPMTEGNDVEILRNGDQIFPVMLEAIAGARHTIDFLTFVYWQGEIGTRVRRSVVGACSRGRPRPAPARRLGVPSDRAAAGR